MWRLVKAAAKRERNPSRSSFRRRHRQNNGLLRSNNNLRIRPSVGGADAAPRALSSSVAAAAAGGGSSPDVAVQLDYYMSLQFAGVACALVNDVYRSKGISSLRFLPTCPVGLEASRVRSFQDANPATLATLGTVEQNVFAPTLRDDPSLKVTAVASMFRRSPLCVASLGTLKDGDLIGAHEDTVELLRRIFPHQRVVASPRGTKITDLLDGTHAGIQAYATTEVPTLRRLLEGAGGRDPSELRVEMLEDATDPDGIDGSPCRLGYSQVIFSADEALDVDAPDRREAVRAFLEGTFDGWDAAIRDPDEAIRAVAEARRMLKLDDESNDHWHASPDFEREMLELTNDLVKETFVGDRLGVLSADRWGKATKWLLRDEKDVDPTFGMDATGLWRPPSHLLHGNEIGREALHDAKTSASKFERTYGRKPRLAVITVGELARYEHSERRLRLYSNPSYSWFAKSDVGKANGFDVAEVHLDGEATTTEKLLSEVYKLREWADGVQIMWPLPTAIDASRVYNAVPLDQDVDGIHYASWGSRYLPVTPAGAMELMKAHDVEVEGKHVLVVGRSPIVGAPMAHLLDRAGAMVTVAHTGVEEGALEDMVGRADVVVTCAGSPGAIRASWLREGCAVINVGTTFCEESDRLLSDVEGDLAGRAGRYSPVPGGVGPLSIPMLFKNVARAAWDRMEGASDDSWEKEPASLRKSFHFDSYTEALQFAQKVDEMSTIMDHHANMKIVHKCANGVDLEMEFSSFEANELTQKDRDAARAVDLVHGGNPVRMSDCTYDLREESVALFPAEPRGSSRLLRVDPAGRASHFDRFGESIPTLLEGCHVVFNDSRVLDARLSVDLGDGDPVELMLLDLGNVDPSLPCSKHTIQAMIRSESVSKGDTFVEPVSGAKVEVVDFKGIWEEKEESGGNGSDCVVRIHSQDDTGSFLSANGSVPIPPYLNRDAVASDKERYNNVYAQDGGSVAAPTAGLHFTDEVLMQLGEANTSSLTLHVGAGTFMPVLSNDARDHSMHAEHFFVRVGELRSIVQALEAGKPLAVVGTTSTRTLESLYWLGLKRLLGLPHSDDVKQLELGQFEWIPLAVADSITPVAAINAIIDGLYDDEVVSGKTSLMITPNSYKFKVIDHLVTNFHAPDSTLMLLVSAFLGKRSSITKIYEDAQRRGYRFLSYGDACLFSKPVYDRR